ncbi:ATP-binding cassette domain-containing protein [Kibdelosporangium philippinense]|uniref:ATP-binding cassette domain-containing protein n=2 Tax=Kibdelosporangium philippinense TaxID=211113 RepID=A0ABS8ZGV3_9PSEU|nr:ATP-binding cassette domain-containing protein [Kibdelosporangium philippinense]MCE7007054.1 ATP-binding cassette domain-containing protein [Kibdelosporangium philippinense]
MIRVDGLGKSFGRRTLWSGLEITVDGGQVAVITGLSGSGKTTLLNCLSLLDRPTEGSITYGRTEVTALSRSAGRRYRRDNIGYLFQDLALIEDATVAENLRLARTTRRDHAIRQQEALDRVDLGGTEKEKVFRLSGGEQQRVALAQLLIKSPPILLLDEPTSALDNVNSGLVVDIMSELATAGTAVIVATHNEQIRECADIECELVLQKN